MMSFFIVCKEIGIGDCHLLMADASDVLSVQNMVQSTKVVLTTVGNNLLMQFYEITNASNLVSA